MKIFKFVFIATISLVTAIALFIAAFPSLVSSNRGKEYLLSYINNAIPGTLKVDNLKLSWLSPSQIDGIELLDTNGQSLASIKSIDLQSSLFRLMTSSRVDPQLNVTGAEAYVVARTDGVTNIEKALSFKAQNLPSAQTLEPIKLESFNMTSEFMPEVNRVKFHAEGNTLQGTLKGQFNLKGDLGDVPVIDFNATQVPVVLIDQFLHLQAGTPAGFLSLLFGSELNLSTNIDGNTIRQENRSENFNSVLNGTINDRVFTLSKDMVTELTLTPAAFETLKQFLHKEDLPPLSRPTQAKMVIKTLTIPFDNPKGTKLDGDLTLSETALGDIDFKSTRLSLTMSPEDPTLTLSGSVDGKFKGEDLLVNNFIFKSQDTPWKDILNGDGARARYQGTLTAEQIKKGSESIKITRGPWEYNGRDETAKLQFTAFIKDIPFEGAVNYKKQAETIDFTLSQTQPSGKSLVSGNIQRFSQDNRQVDIKAELSQFPSETIAAFLPQTATNALYSLFGYSVTGTASVIMENNAGPVSVGLKGERCNIKMEGFISNDELTLRQPLTMDFTVSKEVSDYFLDELVPLLNSATHADNPIRLVISDKGFRVPLKNLTLSSITLPSGSIDLGKIYFTKEGKLAEIMSVLNLPTTETLSVWFTPLYFSLENGILTLARLDMLISNSVPIATWGKIDFPRDSVRMEVGLTGRALASSFGPLPLPKSYMLAIPLRGPVSNPKLDKTKITAKLASLAAMATGPQGLIVGGLIQLASGTFTDTIPNPTTTPLPWETDAPESKTDASESTIPTPKPVKELKKGAEKLLNRLTGG